jgi:hypothetical protein
MLYNVYEQLEPVRTERKDFAGRHVYESDIRFVSTIEVPVGEEPIAWACYFFSIDHPLVSAIRGYTDEGKVRQ